MGKIDIHNSARAWENVYNAFLEDEEYDPHNKEAVVQFIKLAKRGGRISGGETGPRKLIKYLYVLRSVMHQLNHKRFDKVTAEEWEQWFDNLRSGKLKTMKGKRIGDQTKNDLVKDIKTFMKHYEGGKYISNVLWFRKETPLADKPAYTLAEVKALVKKAQRPDLKAYIALAFESGARTEELHNIRKKHFIWDAKTKCFFAFIQYPKGKPGRGVQRNCELPLFTTVYDKLMKSPEFKALDDDEPIFPFTSRHYYGLMKEIDATLHVYKLRHSSWTYWGSQYDNPQQLNVRMGETPMSPKGNLYIDRFNFDTKKKVIVERARSEEVTELREELEKLRQKQAEYDKIFDALREKTLSGHRV